MHEAGFADIDADVRERLLLGVEKARSTARKRGRVSMCL